eukprot:scaffold27685_cov63-Cyclotella_meneghiniana.AAC.4
MFTHSGLRCPYPNGPILSRRNDEFTIGGEGPGGDTALFVTDEYLEALGGGRVIHPYGSVGYGSG